MRIPKLAGAVNFRELGGYTAADGRKTRWGTLFRSGSMHSMTEQDLEHIATYGIRYVCDLRSNSERRSFPSRLPHDAGTEFWFLDRDQPAGDFARLIDNQSKRAEHSRQFMLQLYRKLPYVLSVEYRNLFMTLADNRAPLVFHCMAGKDRTGVAAALLLTALGVSREVIVEDYLLTEQSFEQIWQLTSGDYYRSSIEGLAREIREPMMRADVMYLEAMFDQLIATHGSVDRYLLETLGVDERLVRKLRDQLLDA